MRGTCWVHDILAGTEPASNGLKAGAERGFNVPHLFSTAEKLPGRVGEAVTEPGRVAREESPFKAGSRPDLCTAVYGFDKILDKD